VLCDDAEVFFEHELDLAIEVLGGVEPAGDYVQRLLADGVPVVTANKSLMAARGTELRELARRTGTTLRYEASVIAGIPFLGTLLARPLVAQVTQLAGIFNGTSNYILSALPTTGCFDVALREAQRRGFAEPDPSNDLAGIDAVEKLVVLLHVLGQPHVDRAAIETVGIEGLQAVDLAQAAALGGVIKPVAYAAIEDDGVAAFVGPAFVPQDHPLARVAWEQNGIELRTRLGSELVFTGPGAGPEVTAATILDDVCEAATERADRRNGQSTHQETTAVDCVAPRTPWFVRLEFTDRGPAAEELVGFLGTQQIWLERTVRAERAGGGVCWYGLTYATTRLRVDLALAALRRACGCATLAIRGLEA
jgi:homoserine dehydrogenase